MIDNRIIKLDKSISNKIAAGEVVERPSAVIKELVENSIDAGADNVTVEIKKGGKEYIRITDNGSGIADEDVEIAFERHATSKIRTINDIYNISSLGFRGEALASIAAVSRTEMVTKQRAAGIGTKIEIAGGSVVYKDGTGCPDGTTIIITDLFYNTPARKKFMKSDQGEYNAISDIMNKLALSHPEVSFKYISNGKNIFITPGDGDVFKAIISIYERSLSKNLIKLESEANGMKITGFISNLEFTRGNRQYQMVFVNGRYVRSNLISEAIAIAYKTRIPINRFPVAFLSIELDPSLVDINIHPAKTEIRFHQEGHVKDLIYKGIREELNRHNLVPKQNFDNAFMRSYSVDIKDKIQHSESSEENKRQAETAIEKPKEHVFVEKEPELKPAFKPSPYVGHSQSLDANDKKIVAEYIGNVKESVQIGKALYETSNAENPAEKPAEEPSVVPSEEKSLFDHLEGVKIERNELASELAKEASYETVSQVEMLEEDSSIYDNLNYVGQIFRTYLLFEKNDEMYMIDQHAAHEKINYEAFLKAYNESKLVSQILLDPITLDLSYMDKEKVLTNKDLFSKLGFAVEEFGEKTIIFREVPMMFSTAVSIGFIHELINNLTPDLDSNYSLGVKKIISMSCKKAIKGNQGIDVMEVDSLIKALKGLQDPYTCPHGRPVIISIRKYELEKKFKRA